jgi:hypothetical protein
MSETADIIEAQIEKFDELRETFCDENIRCFLLKEKPGGGSFTVVMEITAGWYFRWNEYRQAMRLAIATIDDDFPDLSAQATHFGVGVPDGENMTDVYVTEDDQRDRVPPNGANPYWKFYLLPVKEERFMIV